MIKTKGENKMKQEIKELHALELKIHEAQGIVLQKMIRKATNGAIIDFLIDLLKNQYDVPRLNKLLDSIHELKLYELNVGSKVSKGFDEEFTYYYSTDYNKDGFCDLIFEINDDNIIENIQYNAK
jgi:hypothetical protein